MTDVVLGPDLPSGSRDLPLWWIDPQGSRIISKKHRRDLLQDHREWVEHAYNPGYWINRVDSFDLASWRWARKHSKFNGMGLMIVFGLGVAAMVYPAIEEGRARGISFVSVMVEEATIPVTVGFVLMFLAGLAFFVQKPVRKEKQQQ